MFKIISQKSIFKGIIFEVFEDKLVGEHGEFAYQYITHPGAVMIIPQDADGKFHMIRQYRHAIGKEILEFPAGLIEPNEEKHISAQRELQEEIGKAAHNMKYLGEICTVPGYANEIIYTYYATDLYNAELPKDTNEVISVEKYTKEEIMQLVKENKIIDAKTLSGILMLGL